MSWMVGAKVPCLRGTRSSGGSCLAAGAPLFSTGGESVLGLPADFLIEPDGRVRAARYGRHANDQWSVDELLSLASTPSTDWLEQRQG
jgi:hypothetical protein